MASLTDALIRERGAGRESDGRRMLIHLAVLETLWLAGIVCGLFLLLR